jgi:hypothetical protein
VKSVLFAAGALIACAGGYAAAQSSPQYRVTGSSLVSTSGTTSSPAYQAVVSGGSGAPAQAASSPQYAVVLGSTEQPPVDATDVFGNGFE